ncbi:hypothetical protein [Carboxydothermus pertinax]|uniref:Uncharacterized protein n=1 Tax=Carboxydothermus pertinax TaxID=870242 RepID=A0A1L8CWH0_9THEO|nr:hypothetical protein [Carboxydothermus pertinax]GAV23285.1 hypothetical protein cpu_17950 [Carboxydothermus pertinax]
MHRVLYALGAFPKDIVPKVAEALYHNGYYNDQQFRVRLFAIGSEKNKQLQETVVQLTWEELLDFIYNRFSEYRAQKAQNEQWDKDGGLLYQLSLRLFRGMILLKL